MGSVAAEQLAWLSRRAAMWRKTTLRGGLGPDGAARTAAINRRTDDAPADEFMESRRRHDSAEVRVDRQEIGEYAAMCCKRKKDKKKARSFSARIIWGVTPM